eukprot:TRINITY_DN9322_c0_g1_i1.p1 TRINITY_DN9322_c0_g1~~TRINITY_DN9322_c0_g1_i1.p1  ORF type:complete len:351 (-),score=80.11 TRINITY_DN9322_c0_g1_i1:53-1105(-)
MMPRAILFVALCVVVLFSQPSSSQVPTIYGKIASFTQSSPRSQPLGFVTLPNGTFLYELNVTSACDAGQLTLFNTMGGVFIPSLNQMYVFSMAFANATYATSFWVSIDLGSLEMECLVENFTSEYSNLRHFFYDQDFNAIIAINQDPLTFMPTAVLISLPSFAVKSFGVLTTNFTWAYTASYDYQNKVIYTALLPMFDEGSTYISTIGIRTGKSSCYPIPATYEEGNLSILGIIYNSLSSSLQAIVIPDTTEEVFVSVGNFAVVNSAYEYSQLYSNESIVLDELWNGQITLFDGQNAFVLANGGGDCSPYFCKWLVQVDFENGQVLGLQNADSFANDEPFNVNLPYIYVN